MRDTAIFLLKFLLIIVAAISSGCAIYDSRPTDLDAVPSSAVPDINLYVEVQGSGSPVILIHGFAANKFTWRYLAPELAKTHKVYLLDLKGFGKSPKPDDSAYTIVDQARLVLKFIDENKLSHLSIVGHSYGGGVALICALLLEREGLHKLDKLVLLDSVAYRQEIPLFIELLATPILGSLVANTLPENIQVRNVLEKAYYNDSLITDEIVEAYSEPLKDKNAISAMLATAHSIIPSNIDVISLEYANLKVPTKLVWGRDDEIVPLKIGEKLNKSIHESTLDVIDACGHIPQEECPTLAIPPILEFLKQ